MRYSFIAEHQDQWPVSVQCEVLKVSRSGFYAWRTREPSQTEQRQIEMTRQIQEIHQASRQTYGAPRVHAELLARGTPCNRKTIAKYMKQARIQANSVRRFRVTTTDSNHRQPVAPNVVDRQFSPSRKNETWAGDVTYISTKEGWLYLAVVEDLFTREIVGWAMSSENDSRLVVDALQMGLSQCCPGENLVAHSDRGVQYASEHYQRLLKKHGITCSMSRKGNCWDNAPVESFFATLKKELVHHQNYATRAEARQSLFDFIEVFYNRKRRHSGIGYLIPAKFAKAV